MVGEIPHLPTTACPGLNLKESRGSGLSDYVLQWKVTFGGRRSFQPLEAEGLSSPWFLFYLTFHAHHCYRPWTYILQLLPAPSSMAAALAGPWNTVPSTCIFSPPQLCVSLGASSSCFDFLKPTSCIFPLLALP